MKFNKELFNQNAESNIKKILSSHLDVLDGKDVLFENDDKYGQIPYYEAEGEGWYLYPVCREWCEESDQLALF